MSPPRGQPPSVLDRPLEDGLTWFIRLTDAFGRLCYLFLADVRIDGLELLPRGGGPLILASNHASNADPTLLASYVTPVLRRRIHWLGKQEALDWPLIGWALAQNGVFGIRRGSADVEAFRVAKRVLDHGHVLGVFPEGTRSPTGVLQRAKDGLAVLALRTGAPILPVGVAGTFRFWPKGQAIPRPRPRLTVSIGEVLRPEDVVAGLRRREATGRLTDVVMRRIAALLPPGQRGAYAAEAHAAGADAAGTGHAAADGGEVDVGEPAGGTGPDPVR